MHGATIRFIAWKAFENVCGNFLGSEIAENYSEMVLGRIPACCAMECDLSLKLNFFAFPFGFFPPRKHGSCLR